MLKADYEVKVGMGQFGYILANFSQKTELVGLGWVTNRTELELVVWVGLGDQSNLIKRLISTETKPNRKFLVSFGFYIRIWKE